MTLCKSIYISKFLIKNKMTNTNNASKAIYLADLKTKKSEYGTYLMGSINIGDLLELYHADKLDIYTSEKTGKQYLTLFVKKKKEEDQYGNSHYISCFQKNDLEKQADALIKGNDMPF